MCSVLVSAELRTLVPHTAHGSSYFGRLSLVLWRAAPSPPPPPPPPLAAPAPSRGTCRHHPQQLRQARWRSGWPGPGRGVVAIVTLPHPRPAASRQTQRKTGSVLSSTIGRFYKVLAWKYFVFPSLIM